MNSIATVTQTQLEDFLLNVAPVRPIFIWGAPGIGKSSLVEKFAASVGLECVSLLGSQLAPEDLVGVPQIVDGTSRFCPPRMIARGEPYCLFLDELNACSQEVQKAFYSLINDRRIAEYHLPGGSIVIGAGNRAQDAAIVKPMSSALINRMIHVELTVSHRDWLEWAHQSGIHRLIIRYIENRPDHLWAKPPKHEETFSSPRSWHILSDALHEWGDRLSDDPIGTLAAGCLTPAHAVQFRAFCKHVDSEYQLQAILNGTVGWPRDPNDRDVLYFLAQSLRGHLLKRLPETREQAGGEGLRLAHRSKALLKDLAAISLEMAQLVTTKDDLGQLPSWFMVEVVRDLPRLAVKKKQEK